MAMTPERIEAERDRFVEACPEFPQTKMAVFGDPQFMFSHTRVAERAWMKRAEIAHAENAKLRERVRELASEALMLWFDEESEHSAEFLWEFANESEPEIVRLAEDVGWWLDNFGHKIPLAEWRARQGGVG